MGDKTTEISVLWGAEAFSMKEIWKDILAPL